MNDIKSRSKSKIISSLLLIIGIALAIAGGIVFGYTSANFFSLTFDEIPRLMALSFGMLGPGIILVIAGFWAFFFSSIGKFGKYERKSRYNKYRRVIPTEKQEDYPASDDWRVKEEPIEKDKIKIKCTLCGTLNDEDAAYCDNCGERL